MVPTMVLFSTNFTDELSRAMSINTENEINQIIKDLNETRFENFKALSEEFKKKLNDLDPVDKEETANYILNKLCPEHIQLFDPMSVIFYSPPPPEEIVQDSCFCLRRNHS